MKKLLIKNKFYIFSSLFLIVIWRVFLMLPDYLGGRIPRHPGFLGPVGWANLDGIHYLSISRLGYLLGEKAFFPLYPLLIHFLALLLPFFSKWQFFSRWQDALGITYIALFFALFFFAKLIALDYPKKTIVWSLLFLLFFPTGFFFGSVYTESLFLVLVLITFFLARKKHFLLASIIAGVASATRLVGIFLLFSLAIEYYLTIKDKTKITFKQMITALGILLFSSFGLISYMYYCWLKSHDPLQFIHVQSLFGANRTNGQIILLPQVIYRYIKIFFTVSYTNHDFWVALLEFTTFFFFTGILIFYWRKIRLSYLVFSLTSILLPTLTGTLSSIPRYVLVAFPVFIILGDIKSTKIKIILLILFLSILIITTAFFLRGYFIA